PRDHVLPPPGVGILHAAVAAPPRLPVASQRQSKLARSGSRIASRKRSNDHGHVAGMPRSSRYQLLQPVTHTVFFAASVRSASKASIAAGLALISWHAPLPTCST